MKKIVIFSIALMAPLVAKAEWHHFTLFEYEEGPVVFLNNLDSSQEERLGKCVIEENLNRKILQSGGKSGWETKCGNTSAEFDFDFGEVTNGPILLISFDFETEGQATITLEKDLAWCEAGAERTRRVEPEAEIWCAKSMYVLKVDSYGKQITYDNEFVMEPTHEDIMNGNDPIRKLYNTSH